jgi:hypothetical protein
MTERVDPKLEEKPRSNDLIHRHAQGLVDLG